MKANFQLQCGRPELKNHSEDGEAANAYHQGASTKCSGGPAVPLNGSYADASDDAASRSAEGVGNLMRVATAASAITRQS